MEGHATGEVQLHQPIPVLVADLVDDLGQVGPSVGRGDFVVRLISATPLSQESLLSCHRSQGCPWSSISSPRLLSLNQSSHNS